MEGQGHGQCWIHQATSGDAPAGAPYWLPVPPAPPRTGAGSVATDTGTSRDGGLREQKTPLAGHEAVCLQAAGQAASTEPRDEGHRSCWPQKPSPGLLHPAGSPCTGGCRAPPAPSTAPRLPRGSALCPAPPITGLCLCKRARLGCLFFFFFPVLGLKALLLQGRRNYREVKVN